MLAQQIEHEQHDVERRLLVDRKRLAQMLSVSVRSVDRLRSSGTLPPSIRLGGKVLWRTTDIEAFVESGCPRLTR